MEFETKRLIIKPTDDEFLHIIKKEQENPFSAISYEEQTELTLEKFSNEVTSTDLLALRQFLSKLKDPPRKHPATNLGFFRNSRSREYLKIFRKEGNVPIGYFLTINGDTLTPNVERYLYSSFHHMGYGTELLMGAINNARNMKRYTELYCLTSVHNKNGIALVEKCGGILQEPEFPHQHFFFKEYKLLVSDNL